jgi:hypothetical protein
MKIIVFLISLATLMTACGSKDVSNGNNASDAISVHENLPGDSALYGLVCDGCTDSLLVFLPYSGGDPDTFDIINARLKDRIFGRPRIGDAVSVIVNPENRDEALYVTNISMLTSQWCYMVEPTLRTHNSKLPPLPDSIKRKLLMPLEYSIKLKADNTVTTMGYMRKNNNRQSPAVYPDIHRYTEWRMFNGHLILHADTIAGLSKKDEEPVTDTAEIVMLMRDSLILRIGNKVQGYYRGEK